MPFQVLDLSTVKTAASVSLVEAVLLHTDSSPICRVGPGATPSGSMPSDQGAREHKAVSEAANAAAEEGNVLEFLLHLPCTLSVHGYMCVLVSFKLWGPPLTFQTFVVVFWLQGGLRTCGIGQEGGKENVDPAPKGKPPRTPRAKKVCTVFVNKSGSVGADRFRLPNFDAQRPSGIGCALLCAWGCEKLIVNCRCCCLRGHLC